MIDADEDDPEYQDWKARESVYAVVGWLVVLFGALVVTSMLRVIAERLASAV